MTFRLSSGLSRPLLVVGMTLLGVVFLSTSDKLNFRDSVSMSDVEPKHNRKKPSEAIIDSTGKSLGCPANSTASPESTSTRSLRRVYKPRGRPMSEQSRQVLIEQWGSWDLDEEIANIRRDNSPENDYYREYPHRDVPSAMFPPTAWQMNSTYLSHFLTESIRLVERAQEAILAEYGKGKRPPSDRIFEESGDKQINASTTIGMQNNTMDQDHPITFEERSRMFQVFQYEDGLSDIPKRASGDKQGGWTTRGSWEGLKRRILHAIMTEDTFVFAMGGHSAAAGHGYVYSMISSCYGKMSCTSKDQGQDRKRRDLLSNFFANIFSYRNHFQQSYTVQIQWILEAVFARMGVRLVARNFGNGGLGTVHNAIGSGSIYGPDVDILMWDSGMTESSNRCKELFHRQGLIGGIKVPVLWTLADKIARELHRSAGVEIGVPGSGMSGLPSASDYDSLMARPFAMRYLECHGAVKGICKDHKYNGVCWVERPDFTPKRKQDSHPGGRAGWHPGNMEHQLTGRVLTFSILQATKEALRMWYECDGHLLPDEVWHVNSHYENIRRRLAAAPLEPLHCVNYAENGMDFMCKYPMKARTEFTPRAFPVLSNIRSLMPIEMRANINDAEDNIYKPPDVFNPSLHPPSGEIDVLSIVELGSSFDSILSSDWAEQTYRKPRFSKSMSVPAGKGVNLKTQAGDTYCDGSVDSWCSRGPNEPCLLRAHNDGRNGLVFDSYSGWLAMNIPDLKNGYIVIKFESWHQSGSAYKTNGWTTVNNETQEGRSSKNIRDNADQMNMSASSHAKSTKPEGSEISDRKLKKKPPSLCSSFRFEYAINGNVTSLDQDSFNARKQNIARVVETLVLLEDPNFTGGTEQEVEVAIRISGCARTNTFKLTHIYWT